MALGKKPRNRVEPSFGDEAEEEDFRVEAEERITGPARRRKPRLSAAEDDDEAPRKRSRRSGRERPGFFGHVFGTIRRMIYWSIVLCVWGVIGIGGLVAYYASQMPSASTWSIPDRPPNVKITALDGSLLANRGVTGGEALALEEMSPFLPQAVISIEDRRFYSHYGIDPFGLARAFVNNLTGRSIQGGSTLTQQLAKNLFLSPDRTFERKIQEVLLALWLEHKFTKDQILTLYLNRMYFGSNAYGVEAASQRYFHKSAREVNLAEAATLAGLLKAPTRLSPARDPKAAEERAQVVLGTMREEGYITEDEVKTAMSQPPAKARSYWSGAEHYAADTVMDEVKSLIGEVKSDITVETTLDLRLEKEADKALNDVLKKDGAKLNASQVALVSIDATGAVRALVGGRDYAESQFNRAVKAKRQPGSAFKPFVYAAALEAGYTPDTVMVDGPVKIGNWTPENYEQKYSGNVTLTTALAHSLNTIAAQLVMQVGPDTVIRMAHRLGIESDLQPNASIALGTSEVSLLELTAAYAPFMNGGYKATPHTVSRILDADGKVLYEADYSNPPQVLSEQVVATMNGMLSHVLTEGTGKAAKLANWEAAGKTGTTQSFRDALFVGYTSTLTTGVWFGNDDGTSMKKVTGGGLPARAWKDYMTAALKGYSPTPLFGVGIQPAPAQQPAPSGNLSINDLISGVLPGNARDLYPPAPAAPGAEDAAAANPPVAAPAGQMPAAQVPAAQVPSAQAAPPQQVPPTGLPPAAVQPSRQASGNQQQGRMPPAAPAAVRPGDMRRAAPQPEDGGVQDYREYRGPFDGPVPPGSVGGGPVPPADVGGYRGGSAPRHTTLFDIIMGQ
ncbi:PBP1A family penicillin-binding protein [Rhizobium straminoryzae]|uniref:PBP1A family penicillin-binding protein n=1 Tax=Rhizobium straminoryzae TaxID=1387186 RepID=A0A549T3Q1_9HYPH|nr:PBP1A family penicillin-binding protein [Rhizobium straminoryzae]TRL36496.1 PBP1A family penicillin-binding protein [Rhizobium straminoryzae]